MGIRLVDGAASFSLIVRKFIESPFAFLVSCQFCRIEKADDRFMTIKRSLKNIISNCGDIFRICCLKNGDFRVCFIFEVYK